MAPEFYDARRPDHGQRLPLCVLPGSATAETDRQTATLLAEALLLQPDIVTMQINTDALDSDGIWPDLFVYLIEKCVGMMGAELIAGVPYPDWLTITQPYYTAPFVLVTRDPAIKQLDDLPAGAMVGSPVYTPIDTELAQMIAAGTFGTLRRQPYDDISQVTRFLGEGTMTAAVVWSPYLPELHLPDLHTSANLAPLHLTSRTLGIVLRRQDGALRDMIDQALTALQDDGSLPRP
ncbi:ABC-type amino acid transport/signal transduction systems, periplasmic component/domain protein [Ketogulonicigenium robustum]|uniref:ABC-type amino acid transport/signal transduction systems, periplasmic component/domain protein n=1 Tax=Ketogulonicigenium robustum TaxID=92947 RepID=A0A1W6P1F9_9RHOB|nr:ABC-type amino acid transport/signal transduction systems, periplasmic component/domain protein [Ketogulonicigenium robustum]